MKKIKRIKTPNFSSSDCSDRIKGYFLVCHMKHTYALLLCNLDLTRCLGSRRRLVGNCVRCCSVHSS